MDILKRNLENLLENIYEDIREKLLNKKILHNFDVEHENDWKDIVYILIFNNIKAIVEQNKDIIVDESIKDFKKDKDIRKIILLNRRNKIEKVLNNMHLSDEEYNKAYNSIDWIAKTFDYSDEDFNAESIKNEIQNIIKEV